MDDYGDSKVEGHQKDNGKDYGRRTGDDIKKAGRKVVGGIINKSKEEDNDNDKGPQKCYCSNMETKKTRNSGIR